MMTVETKGNKIFVPLKGTWEINTPEENLKQDFICRLINIYGYKLEQLGQDVEVKKRYKADLAIWRSAGDKAKNSIPSIIITVECKAENIKIKESDYSLGYNLASIVNANFFIATNLRETKIFHIVKDNAPKKLEKLTEIPKAEDLFDEKKINKYVKENKIFTRDQFSKLLSRCHNIIRNNDKLSPEAAFDEISKVLFMKIMFERESKEELIFSKDKFISDEKHYEALIRPEVRKESASLDQDYMQFLFAKTKSKFENDGIFEAKDQIRIKRNSFEMIVEELEAFNLSDTSDDVKGIAFEQFLGKTFRGELGQFFTPRTIVDYMVEILDPSEMETICDPCCGSGGFLITAFEYVKNKIDEDIRKQIKSIKEEYFNDEYYKSSADDQQKTDKLVQTILEKLNFEFDISNPSSRYHNLSHNCIYGTDANPRMARTAKMNMIMHGDGHGGVHHHDGLINVNGIYDNRFDVILTNPPFGARVEKSLRVSAADLPTEDKANSFVSKYGSVYKTAVLNPLKEWAFFNNGKGKPTGKSVLELFELGTYSGLTEVLFLERCLNLLKPGGRMGIVLPEGILNNPKMQKIRNYIEGKAKIINITSIPQDVFIASGATVKPSLLFFKKFDEKEKNLYDNLLGSITNEVNNRYSQALDDLNKRLGEKGISKEDKRLLKNEENEILVQIQEEIRSELKTSFNYKIPIVEVKKAGISSTGSPIDNELEPIAIEFKHYRLQNHLWKSQTRSIKYVLKDSVLERINEDNVAEKFYTDGSTN